MRTRSWIALLLLPLFFAASTAHAIFGIPDVAAMAQRVTIIANQGAQIANQIAQLATLNGQLGKLTEQFAHIKESTLGQVGAITQPFTDLASVPGQLVNTGMAWKSDFTGLPGELATAVEQLGDGTSITTAMRPRLQAADTTTETDILTAYADFPAELATKAAENYRLQRDSGEQSLVLNYAVSDAAAETTAAIKSAFDAYDGLRSNGNVSPTALQQAQVAGQVTQGQLTAAIAQLQAYQAAAGSGGGTGGREAAAGAGCPATRRSAARTDHIQRTAGRHCLTQ